MDISAPVAFLVASVAAAIGVWAGRRSLARRLDRLTDAVASIGNDGETTPAPEEGAPELAEAARAVNLAADRVRQRADASREEQSVRDLILSTMQEGVLLVDPDREIAFANRAIEDHLRSKPTSLAHLLPLALRQAVERAAESGSVVSVETEAVAPTRWLRGTAVPAADAAVLLVVSDVTEAKRLEAVRRDFVANASHELKTPAASIQAAAETIRLAVDDDPAVVPRFADQLEREASRLSRIVADLLDLSRLETGSELGELVRLDRLVREETGRFRELARGARISLDVRAPPAPPVRGSARDLGLLIRNLVDNAVQYTKPGGRIEVSVEGSAGDVVLNVTDTGLGIPSRDLPRIFERFYRVDRARSRETGGTGLGLAIVKHVTENHGGTIDVASELGRGTRFEVRLPAAPRERDRSGTPDRGPQIGFAGDILRG